jgi:hypothetical protein
MSYSPSATTSVCLPPSHSTHPRQDLFFIPILHYCQGYIHSSSTMTLQTCIYLIRFNQMYLIRLYIYIYMYIHLITYTLFSKINPSIIFITPFPYNSTAYSALCYSIFIHRCDVSIFFTLPFKNFINHSILKDH